MLTFTSAEALMRRARNPYKRLSNNTYLETSGPDTYTIRFHATNIVTIHRDGTYTLRNGGWNTPTTKQRINDYSPARVYSENGTWAVWDRDNDPKTAPKIQRCRACQGTGHIHRDAHWMRYDWVSDYQPVFPPKLIMPAYWASCHSCSGTGQRDYGSKTMPVVFFDGITVDSCGQVADADGLPRLNEPAEVTLARAVKVQRSARQIWITRHSVRTDPGLVYLYKAVRADLVSTHGSKYVPGLVVTAKDYQPTVECGAGLHFSPTVPDARKYDSSATRYLLCAVDRKTLIILDDDQIAPKVKARSCRVIAEVDADGNRIAA